MYQRPFFAALVMNQDMALTKYTTTPEVADVLGGPASGDPGVFPTDIALRFNRHVRHHLVHFPDIVVHPGGMSFGTGHSATVPESVINRHFYAPEQLE